MPPRKLTLQEQVDALAERFDASEARQNETHKMVSEIYEAWMKPHPVYGNKSLLDVVSDVAARAAAGEIIGERVVWWAKVLAAFGTISAAFYAAIHLGQSK